MNAAPHESRIGCEATSLWRKPREVGGWPKKNLKSCHTVIYHIGVIDSYAHNEVTSGEVTSREHGFVYSPIL